MLKIVRPWNESRRLSIISVKDKATQQSAHHRHIEAMKRDDPYRFALNEFALPEAEAINQAAYWDYQRDKVYVRSSQRLKQVGPPGCEGSSEGTPCK